MHAATPILIALLVCGAFSQYATLSECNSACKSHATCVAVDDKSGKITFSCVCDNGYMFASDGSCVFNEAKSCRRSPCEDRAKCAYVNGVPTCVCKPGYTYTYPLYTDPIGTLPKCLDDNECTRGTAECDLNEVCVNTEGSYVCSCSDCYTWSPPDKLCVYITGCVPCETCTARSAMTGLCEPIPDCTTCEPCFVRSAMTGLCEPIPGCVPL